MLQSISSAIFTAVLVFMSLLLMSKLRKRFEKFYVEYGCYLWTIVIIQAISLLISTTSDILFTYNGAANDFFDHNDVTYITYVVTDDIVSLIVPTLTQLSCLIFGWIRYRRQAN